MDGLRKMECRNEICAVYSYNHFGYMPDYHQYDSSCQNCGKLIANIHGCYVDVNGNSIPVCPNQVITVSKTNGVRICENGYILKTPKTFSEIQKSIFEWANEVFPNRTYEDAAIKLVMEEIPEFIKDPKSPLEYADLLILILDIASLNGIDVGEAIDSKMKINEARKWEKTKFGMRHIK